MRVLLTVRGAGAGANPYIDIFERALPARVNTVRFSWFSAIFGKYDLIHVQWPEYLFRGSTLPRAALRFVLGATLLFRIVLFRTPVVYTVHNIDSHEEAAWGEKVLSRVLLKQSDVNIYLNESRSNDMSRGVVILHQTYPHVSKGATGSAPRSGYVFFGLLRPYKGIEHLVRAWPQDPSAPHLTILGPVADPAYVARLKAQCAANDNIALLPGYVDEAELELLLTSCEGVVLPYRRMYNSGAVIRALGLGARVLIPQGGATETLRDEVGEEWVTLFTGTIDYDDIQAFTSSQSSHGSAMPDLQNRAPARTGTLTEIVYRTVGAYARLRRRDRRQLIIDELRANTMLKQHSSRNAGTADGPPRERT